MSEQNQEVAKIDPTKYPAFVGSAALGKGHEDETEQSDFIIPRAKLVQYTADEVTAENAEDRVDPGKLINNISKQELPLLFIPVYRYKSYARWNPMDKKDPHYDPAYELGELIFSTTDKKDERVTKLYADGSVEVDNLAFGPNGEPPLVTMIYNYLCMFPGERLPLLLSFKRTSLRAARNLNTLLQMAGGDMFSNKYRIVISRHEEGSRKWFTMDVKGAGKCTAEEHKMADEIFEHFKGKGPNVAQSVESAAAPEKPDQNWTKE